MRNKFPPKLAIANEFVIGSMPQVLQRTTANGEKKSRVIAEHELTNLLKAMMAPVRPYGLIFSYTGGAQKALRGNYQIFEMDQNRIGGVIHQLNKSGIREYIYCVLCGRMTVDEKRIIREWSTLDTQLFIDIMTWFVQQSGHPGFKDTSIPEECPQLILVGDSETNNKCRHMVQLVGELLLELLVRGSNPSGVGLLLGSIDRGWSPSGGELLPELLVRGSNSSGGSWYP